MSAIRLVLSRRMVLAGLGAAMMSTTHRSFATPARAGRKKLMLVMLRGGLDGLAAVPPLDAPYLSATRPTLAPETALPLSDGFGLHPSLPGLHRLYHQGEAAIVHAISGPYRIRSHFLAQDVLQSGTVDTATRDGWLNRALQRAPGPLTAVSVGPARPLLLRGPQATATWSPRVLPEADPDLLPRLQTLYDGDTLLQRPLEQAIALQALTGDMPQPKGERSGSYETTLTGAARLMAGDTGADIAVAALDGWDTHTAQAGMLQKRLASLDAALTEVKHLLAEDWANTTIVLFTEFGRTVRENGSRGTDHGTGGAAFLLGGAVKGGQMLGDWPGLRERDLFEGRDLTPANDFRGLFGGLLTDLFGLERRDLHRTVFPGSRSVRTISALR